MYSSLAGAVFWLGYRGIFLSLINMLREFFRFLRKPTQNLDPAFSFKGKIRWFLFVLLMDFILGALAVAVNFVLQEWFLKGVEIYQPDYYASYTILEKVLFAGLLIPFIEELVFRLNLKCEKSYINISVGVLSVFFVFWALSTDVTKWLALIPTILALLFFVNNDRAYSGILKVYDNHYPFVFYAFAILFVLMHLSNLNLTGSVILYTPLLLISQIGGALTSGFIRLKNGFFWAVAGHCIFNTVLFMIDYGVNNN